MTTYFDTPAGALGREGVSLRIRRSGDQRIQTAKLLGDGEGVAARRGEWEWPIEGDTPELDRLAETPAGPALAKLDGALRPLCATEIIRTVRLLRLDEAVAAEVAIDEGEIQANGTGQPVSELEIELKEGRAGPLYRLALDLSEAAPLVLEPASKLARGAAMAGAAGPPARKAPDLDLAGDASAAEAFRRIIGSVLGHLLANMGPADRGDSEGIHQTRVALRRLRAALTLFQPRLEPHAVGRFNDELRRAGRIFGAARDWDVFVLETLAAAEADGAEPGWLGLLGEAAGALRNAAHGAARTELGAPRFTLLLLGLAAWAEDGAQNPALLGTAKLTRPIAEVAPALLDRMTRKVSRRGRKLAHAMPPELHALRKAMKKLRYGIEFLGGLYPHKRVKAYLGPCKDLQELLGQINDAAATPALAEQIAAAGHVGLTPAVGAIAHWAERRDADAKRHLPKAWRSFRVARPFWD